MEVMHRAIVKSRLLKPLPGEITNQRINDATLPVKIEAARRAIAECQDLPELLRYKSQAEGLAAAVRTMKEVGPAMIRSANEMMADAWRKGGELLGQYSRVPPPNPGIKGLKIGEKGFKSFQEASPRGKIMSELGIPKHEGVAMVRLATASKTKVYTAVKQTNSLRVASRMVPAVNPEYAKTIQSDGMRVIMRALGKHAWEVKAIPLESFKDLTPDERKIVKSKITEITELLDEMDRLCR